MQKNAKKITLNTYGPNGTANILHDDLIWIENDFISLRVSEYLDTYTPCAIASTELATRNSHVRTFCLRELLHDERKNR